MEVYRRVFEENEPIFFDDGANVDYFVEKYGEQFVNCFEIDNNLLRQFNILVKDSINKYIDIFSKISHTYGRPSYQTNTHRKTQPTEIAQPRMGKTSIREKTPTKSARKQQFRNKTPTHKHN